MTFQPSVKNELVEIPLESHIGGSKKFHHFLVEKYPEKFHGSDVTVHANQVM
jgi:hypothetical protein